MVYKHGGVLKLLLFAGQLSDCYVSSILLTCFCPKAVSSSDQMLLALIYLMVGFD